MTKGRRNSSGFVLVTVAIFMLALIALAGFAVDLGSWYLRANKIQRVSDAAALAGVAALPDQSVANGIIKKTLENNGFANDSVSVTSSSPSGPNSISVSVTDHAVPTYFLKMLKSSISISRTSDAEKGSRNPKLGSPYNVLGTGNLQINGVPEQNFWLAINGRCEPKEDGDYFNAWYDANKGPMTAAMDDNHYFVPDPSARHHCPIDDGSGVGKDNPSAGNGSGYNYYVDIPPTQSGSVDISVYDGAYDETSKIDQATYMSTGNDVMVSDETQFAVYRDVNNTPEDSTDDGAPVGGSIFNTDGPNRAIGDWKTIYTASGGEITHGAHYRINVSTASNPAPIVAPARLGINAFAIAAFKSGTHDGCDTRTSSSCPRVYGSAAMSVFNSLSSKDAGKIDYYFADIDKSFVGTTLSVFLWDPGEGVDKFEIVGPSGKPLSFDWSATPDAGGMSGSANYILTKGYAPPTQANVSNDYRFNDRLITIKLKIPDTYPAMVDASNGDTGLRFRWTVNDSPNDRMTFGMAVGDGVSSPTHLVKK